MGSDLLRKWLTHYDPVHRGWTLRGIASGTCGTGGWFFPRVRGGYHLRRSSAGLPTLDGRIVGAAGADGADIRTFPWVEHEPGVAYVYRLFAVGGGGEENVVDEVTATAGFDAEGAYAGAVPAGVADLRVTPAAGGAVEVVWTYGAVVQGVEPAAFHVYHDGGADAWGEEPAGVVGYRRGRVHYRWRSASFGHDVLVRARVRAANAQGFEESGERVAGCRTVAAAPAVSGLVVRVC